MQNQSWFYHFFLSARTNLYKDINQSLPLQGKNKVVASKEKWKNQPCVFFLYAKYDKFKYDKF